jgi:hypothetical protein
MVFMAYLTTLSVGQKTKRRMVVWLESNELERVWKEALMA